MNRKVLVIEKEAKYFQQAVIVLSRDGHEVIAAETGTEAVARVRDEEPWLVVLGDELPDMSGEQMLEQLGITPFTPGHSFGVILLQPYPVGFVDGFGSRSYPNAPGFCLYKPFNPMELKMVSRRLRTIMDGAYSDRTVR